MGMKRLAKVMNLGKDEELKTVLYILLHIAIYSTNHHTFINLNKRTNLNKFLT